MNTTFAQLDPNWVMEQTIQALLDMLRSEDDAE